MTGFICAHCGSDYSEEPFATTIINDEESNFEEYSFCDGHCMATWSMNQSVHYNAEFDATPPQIGDAIAPKPSEGGSEINYLPTNRFDATPDQNL